MYTEAIFCKVPPAKKAIYYCNRAFAHYRMESYAICVFDGCEAIKLDPTNVKGYFRRGQGYAMQRQLKNAVADFKTICKMQPANKEAREKFECTQKEYRLQQLSLAIVSDETRVEAKVEDMIVEASYAGPKLETADDVTAEWVVSMMEWQKSQKRVHKKFATMIIQRATEIFEKDETLVHISIDELEEITVCGDVHGQYYDLLNLFSINGNPSEENPYLFNGDFIDRGSFSVEVVLTMLAWKVCYP
jgi:serine/threonine-protein phosphatase 5